LPSITLRKTLECSQAASSTENVSQALNNLLYNFSSKRVGYKKFGLTLENK